ncbi:MAG: hypothetical protein MZV64_14095 [Ignavibacteriales bacterium]|nr:hypothetical protein [Ignavibacteriales bacterium]
MIPQVLNFWGNDICFMNENIGLAVGRFQGAGVLKTTDGGDSWDMGWSLPDTNSLEYDLKSIYCIDTTCWTVGEVGMIVKYTPQTGWVQTNC